MTAQIVRLQAAPRAYGNAAHHRCEIVAFPRQRITRFTGEWPTPFTWWLVTLGAFVDFYSRSLLSPPIFIRDLLRLAA